MIARVYSRNDPELLNVDRPLSGQAIHFFMVTNIIQLFYLGTTISLITACIGVCTKVWPSLMWFVLCNDLWSCFSGWSLEFKNIIRSSGMGVVEVLKVRLSNNKIHTLKNGEIAQNCHFQPFYYKMTKLKMFDAPNFSYA